MVCVGWLLLGAVAYAQDEAVAGFDAHGFQLAAHDGDQRDPLVARRPGSFTQWDWFASGVAEYAKTPLVRLTRSEFGDDEPMVTPVVDNLVALNVSAGVAVHDRVRLDLKAPIYGLSTDRDLVVLGPAMGDLRGSATLIAVRPEHVVGGGGFGLGLTGWVDVPSGTPDRFLGQAGVAGGASVQSTWEGRVITLTGDVGTQFNPSLEGFQNIDGTDTLIAALGIGVLTSDVVGITLEAVAEPSLQATRFEQARTDLPAEALLSLRYAARNSSYWTFGAAGGLTDGPGVAAFRVFVGGGFAQAEDPRPADFDRVGQLRTSDLCPLEPETVNGYKDDDGCPDVLGALSIEVTYQGQPREAEAEITGPDGTEVQLVGLQGLELDAVPDSEWTVVARTGCLSGEASTVVREAGAVLEVALTPVYDAEVLVEVVDNNDQPIDDAQVMWRTEASDCVPMGPQQVNEDGLIEQAISSGAHTLVATAPNHTVHEQTVEFQPGDDQVIRVRLGAAMVKVEKKQIRILEKVLFETAKAVIRAESFQLLNEVAATIVTNPDLGRVEVSGHTDNRGGEGYNQGLSDERAASVVAYLVEAGVAAERLLAVGYGESEPVSSNRTPEGREKNRRVEFILIDSEDVDSESEGSKP